MSPGHGVHDERTARIAWARLAEPADTVAAVLVTELGHLGAFEELVRSRGAVRVLGRTVDRFAARLPGLDVDRELEVTSRTGARVLVPGDPDWPPGVDDLEIPPGCLWARGPARIADVCSRSVSVVGARAATHYGTFVAGEIAGGLAQRGFAVVSGAAFGIDGAAHRAALGVEGTTVAVLAGGVERPYPRAHADLLAAIARTGVVLSEVPPGSAPTRTRFLSRNRLIAALSTGTVVVEAGLRSGARSTAERAASLGRPVAAVPGPVTSMVSAGCHEEIRQGRAVLVTDAAEVAELLSPFGEALLDPPRGERRAGDGLTEGGARVHGTLRTTDGLTVDDLAVRAGLGTGEVMAALGELTAAGLARERLDGWVRVGQ